MYLHDTEIAAYAGGKVVIPGERVANAIEWDTRRLAPDMVFLANKGASLDGHDLCDQALDAGVSGIIISQEVDETVYEKAREKNAFVVRVGTPAFETIQTMAAGYRVNVLADATVIGVTGSVGKTSTKEMLVCVLEESFSVASTYKNFNSEWGVCQTILSADEDTEVIVLEMGMRNKDDISKLCRIARPSIGIITKIGTSHVGRLGSKEQIAEAKRELFDALLEGGTALVPANDDWRCHLVDSPNLFERCHVIGFGGDKQSGYEGAVWHENLSLAPDGKSISFATAVRHITAPDGSLRYADFDVDVSMSGAHNADNACAVIGCAMALGMDENAIKEGLKRVHDVVGRQSIESCRSRTFDIIDASYNASPESVKATLDLLEQMECAGTRYMCLGDMEELGAESDKAHDEIGSYIANSDVLRGSCLLTLGEKGARISESALAGGMDDWRVLATQDIDEMFEHLQGRLRKGDIVAVKASNSVGLTELVNRLKEL